MAVADPVAPAETSAVKSDDNTPPAVPSTVEGAAEPAKENSTAANEKRAAVDDEDGVNPPDFQGEVLTNNDLPSQETIRRIGDYIVLDRHGKTHTFKSLYTGRNVARRVLIIFVRHFFCGVSFLEAFTSPHPLFFSPGASFFPRTEGRAGQEIQGVAGI